MGQQYSSPVLWSMIHYGERDGVSTTGCWVLGMGGWLGLRCTDSGARMRLLSDMNFRGMRICQTPQGNFKSINQLA